MLLASPACVLTSARPAVAALSWMLALSACIPADRGDLALLEDRADAGTTALAPRPARPSQKAPTKQASSNADDTKPVLLGFACKSPERGPYHPAGYADSAVHGTDFKLQKEDCRTCHGAKLEGCDFAGGCDDCHDGGHPSGWRTQCTYCHGGTNDDTGAPPSELVRDQPASEASFLAHGAHVVGTLHAPYDCTQCHVKPSDVMSPGHAFDDTKGAAEVTFAAGLSPDASYDGQGGCSNVYCHGNRRENGSIRHDASATDCNACHAFDDAKKLSGRHDAHINGGLLAFLYDRVACTECHADVVGADGAIIGPQLHVNGRVDLSIEKQGIHYDGTRCSGSCHNALHTFISTWQP